MEQDVDYSKHPLTEDRMQTYEDYIQIIQGELSKDMLRCRNLINHVDDDDAIPKELSRAIDMINQAAFYLNVALNHVDYAKYMLDNKSEVA